MGGAKRARPAPSPPSLPESMPDHAIHPRRHSRLLTGLGRGALRMTGWRIVGEVPPVPKFVAIVAPHTSNWDFLVGVAVMFALDLKVGWLGKHTIFKGPWGGLLRAMGGRPVRRTESEGVVGEVAAAIRSEPRFILGLAPEGTRSRVAHWKTGFYHIAQAAGIPILPVWLDYSRREIGLGEPMMPTGDLESDIARLQAVFRPEMGRHPELFWSSGAT
jgi:1-acyl-sn-glycerol-3-phosphate acyltransferase